MNMYMRVAYKLPINSTLLVQIHLEKTQRLLQIAVVHHRPPQAPVHQLQE